MNYQLAALIVLALLQCADLYTTSTILGRGGRELNPIVAQLMKAIGIIPALIVKGIGVVVLGWWGGTLATAVLIAAYIITVAFNWRSMP